MGKSYEQFDYKISIIAKAGIEKVRKRELLSSKKSYNIPY